MKIETHTPPQAIVPSDGERILEVAALSKHFFLKERGVAIPSACRSSFNAVGGRLVALSGPSGAGKSSVLKCLYRTYLPCGGEILYRQSSGEWIDLARASERQVLELRRWEIGFVTQFLHFLPRQSTLDVVAQPLIERGVAPAFARERAAEVLERLDIPRHLWTVAPATFSGGEKQRVNLARGFAAPCRLLLLDEPTASLDRPSVRRVVDLIEESKRSGGALVAVFHDAALVAELADGVVALTKAESELPA